jgi:hypothetical protein
MTLALSVPLNRIESAIDTARRIARSAAVSARKMLAKAGISIT